MSETYALTSEEVESPTEDRVPLTASDSGHLSLAAIRRILNNAAFDVVIESTATGARRASNEYHRLCQLLGDAERRGLADVSALKMLMK